MKSIIVRRLVGGRVYERKVPPGGWLTTDETMRLLGVSRRQVFYLRRRGVLHPRKVGGRLRFKIAELLRLRKGGGDDQHGHDEG